MMVLSNNIFSRGNVLFLLAGMRTTIVVAASTTLIALFFDAILGLVRNYDHGILGKPSAVYIGTPRNTPLIFQILVARLPVPIPAFYSEILSMPILTTAIMAEMVRGGLNSINEGQFETAYSQDFDFFRTLRFIIVPQYFEGIVPSLLSQMITIVKDTSFLQTVTIEEFTSEGVILVGRFASFTQVFVLLAFMAGTYFIINLTLSSIMRRQNVKGQSLRRLVLVEAQVL